MLDVVQSYNLYNLIISYVQYTNDSTSDHDFTCSSVDFSIGTGLAQCEASERRENEQRKSIKLASEQLTCVHVTSAPAASRMSIERTDVPVQYICNVDAQ